MTSIPLPLRPPRARRLSNSTLGRLLRIKLATFGLVIVLFVTLAAVFANIVAPYDPNIFVTVGSVPPSGDNWFGTDHLGRDQLSRVLFGARASLQVAVVSMAIGVTAGIVLGLLAAGTRGIVDRILMRILDAQMAMPGLVLPLLLLSLLGGGVGTVSLSLGIVLVPTIARLVRGQAIAELHRDYVTASQSIGAGLVRILALHVLPNALPPVIVAASLAMSSAVIAEAGLSFLGVGVTPPESTWGTMLSTGFSSLRTSPWIVFVPGTAIFLLVLAFNFLGDGLRDVLDPRLRGKL